MYIKHVGVLKLVHVIYIIVKEQVFKSVYHKLELTFTDHISNKDLYLSDL